MAKFQKRRSPKAEFESVSPTCDSEGREEGSMDCNGPSSLQAVHMWENNYVMTEGRRGLSGLKRSVAAVSHVKK